VRKLELKRKVIRLWSNLTLIKRFDTGYLDFPVSCPNRSEGENWGIMGRELVEPGREAAPGTSPRTLYNIPFTPQFTENTYLTSGMPFSPPHVKMEGTLHILIA
jgi:hypothetical protein